MNDREKYIHAIQATANLIGGATSLIIKVIKRRDYQLNAYMKWALDKQLSNLESQCVAAWHVDNNQMFEI